ncbi:MAG: (E)-4-hydroxy-3-methylbut-2-enyl-diphosphate synthase [Dysgonamonadaceae bacterium]|jgi:(E)-4-hydroxy-3-methylbut-2-enyl-diphosphate synthase|nr:(E)-4-hydroxy-3-methylbut-2-enyl-diphosphate synthase [Dysgonamonadaceae bacterium]
MSSFQYKRRKSSEVFIGNTPLGGDNPIRIQSMTNTSTMDTEASIAQCIRIVEAGGEYVRLTAQGVGEAENLRYIRDGLRKRGYQTPLVADIHFNPNVAYTAAGIVEKVRINPGNFADPAKKFQKHEYSEEEYRQGIEKIRARFVPFLAICKANHTAIRIGVNHGSLSDRIMSRYGDTPEGMVESCMEFLHICVEENFTHLVVSIKASNTFVMVTTVRLLVRRMDEEGMNFPLHLGVTEAGDGEDGRIKSAVGIGTLLLEGIGDTIRVSLSEDPEAEIPVAKALVDYVSTSLDRMPIDMPMPEPQRLIKRNRDVPIVIADYSRATERDNAQSINPDFLYLGKNKSFPRPENQKIITDYEIFSFEKDEYPLFTARDKAAWQNSEAPLPFLCLNYSEINDDWIEHLIRKPQTVLILSSTTSSIFEQKSFAYRLMREGIKNPVVLQRRYKEKDLELFQIKSAADCGAFFLDNQADGIFLQNETDCISPEDVNACSFGILQATGRRISKTEYIACPSCGRTLFDLQTTLKKVKAATAHLKGLKIGIMGCIVNGPGEMADADYGYVGAGIGRVSLYKGKECVKKNIPEADAVVELLRLIELGDTK